MFLIYAALFVFGATSCHAARIGGKEASGLDGTDALVDASASAGDGDFPAWASKGSQVSYQGEPATVLAVEMVPVVKLDIGGQTKSVALKYVTPPEEDDDEGGQQEEGEEAGAEMNVRQKIFCEVCLEGVRSSSNYVPAKTMLNGTIDPQTNLGRLKECSPSERDLWTRDDKFTIYMLGKPVPDGCPSQRRAPYIVGKLSLARRICKQAISKGPRSYPSCTDFVNKQAATGSKRQVECTKGSLYTFR
ncbi:unnamed protein product [Prorocentrum cordatum]|uniref:Uncharacterized protein n=1 Tax=Prorocentrum cordatum TaxID=2364126 RepID=A0ABN9XX46_9DINO|nr:unnamed protein product [Polarella glacialis]